MSNPTIHSTGNGRPMKWTLDVESSSIQETKDIYGIINANFINKELKKASYVEVVGKVRELLYGGCSTLQKVDAKIGDGAGLEVVCAKLISIPKLKKLSKNNWKFYKRN